MNLLKKNNGSHQNSLGVHVKELWEVQSLSPTLQNSNTSNFGEIWTIQVNLPVKNNRNGFISLVVPVRELWGVEPPNKTKYHPILMKF